MSNHNRVELSVIVPTTGNEDLLSYSLPALHSALQQVRISYELIIVNDSPNIHASRTALRFARQMGARLVVNCYGRGVAHARNQGARHARGSYLLFMDDDIILHSDWIATALPVVQRRQCAVVANWTTHPPLLERVPPRFLDFLQMGGFLDLAGWLGSSHQRVREMSRENLLPISGVACAYIVPSEIFCRSGGFPERVPFAGAEDQVFSACLRRMGVDIYLLVEPLCFHRQLAITDPRHWLARKVRDAITRRLVADCYGFDHLRISQPLHKRAAFRLAFFFRKFLLYMALRAPVSVSRNIFKLLLGTALWHGYNLPARPHYHNRRELWEF